MGAFDHAAMRDHVRFLLGDDLVRIASCDPTRTLLDWLRDERGLRGTKEGCAEGDCGACTVAVGRLDRAAVRYDPVCACIRLLPTLDGTHVVAIEHLSGGRGPHPVQDATVRHGGSQCGFCTPGFMMALACLAAADPAPDAAAIDDAVAGNLCRCTGYRPIADAAAESCRGGVPLWPEDIGPRLAALAGEAAFAVGEGGRRFLAPGDLATLRGLLAAEPEAVLLGGGTDLGLRVTKDLARPETVIWLGGIPDLARVEERADAVVIGAGVTIAALRRALGRLHPQVDELLRRFGGAQVRAVGTLGGSLGTASPIGDLAPLLIALGATLTLDGPDGPRTLPVEDFFTGYRATALRAGEIVAAASVPRPGGDALHVSKVSKRFDEDISTLCGAFRLARDGEGRVVAARLAFGGMAAVPRRAPAAEAALLGRPFDEDAADRAAAALRDDFAPLDDWRGSARYRLLVAGNLVRRFALEEAGGVATRVAGPLAGAASHA